MELLLSNRREQLDRLLQTMVSVGLVNNEFLQLQSMKLSLRRDIVVQSVLLYWRATRGLFTQMSHKLDTTVVEDFYDVLACAQDLFDRSNCIGAVHVSIACSNIFYGCQEHDKDRCVNGLTTAKREFAKLQVKFESVLELERNIMECEDILAREAQNDDNLKCIPS